MTATIAAAGGESDQVGQRPETARAVIDRNGATSPSSATPCKGVVATAGAGRRWRYARASIAVEVEHRGWVMSTAAGGRASKSATKEDRVFLAHHRVVRRQSQVLAAPRRGVGIVLNPRAGEVIHSSDETVGIKNDAGLFRHHRRGAAGGPPPAGRSRCRIGPPLASTRTTARLAVGKTDKCRARERRYGVNRARWLGCPPTAAEILIGSARDWPQRRGSGPCWVVQPDARAGHQGRYH